MSEYLDKFEAGELVLGNMRIEDSEEEGPGVYKGMVREKNDNIREGYGTMTYDDGSSYQGQWKNDEPNGRGTMTHASGLMQEGQFEGLRKPNGFIIQVGETKSFIGYRTTYPNQEQFGR